MYKANAAIDSESNLLPGRYTVSLIVFDSDERYLAKVNFSLSDNGNLTSGTVRYPIYKCESRTGKARATNNGVTFQEIITTGKNICQSMSYEINVNKGRLYKPYGQNFFSISVLDGKSRIKTDIKKYHYKPTKFAKFRIKYNIKGWKNISSSQNITLLNDYLKLRSKTSNGNKAHDVLYSVVQKKNVMGTYISFVKKYPRSPHLRNAVEKMYVMASKNGRIISLLKELKPIISDDLVIKHIYGLVKKDKSLTLLAEFQRQFSGNLVISSLEYKQEKAKLYRLSNNASDYITAYLLEGNMQDFIAAISLAEGIEEIDAIRDKLKNSFYNSFELDTLIKGYRLLNTFPGYMRAFMLSDKQSDFSMATSRINGAEINNFPNYSLFTGHNFKSQNFDKAAAAFFEIAKKINTIKSYREFTSTYSNTIQANNAVSLAFQLTKQQNTTDAYLLFIQLFPAAEQATQARGSILIVAENKGDITSYKNVIKRFPNTTEAKKAVSAIYKLVSEQNTRKAYSTFIKQYPNFAEAKKARAAIYKLACQENTNNAYDAFIMQYPSSSLVSQAISKKLNLLVKSNKYSFMKNKETIVEEYKSFIESYPYSSSVSDAIVAIFNIRIKQNEIPSYLSFLKNYPESPEAIKVITSVYKLVHKERNISGYDWFMNKFPSSPEAKFALRSMHHVAYEIATDIDTVAAYNDFVIAFPLAKEMKEANKNAYKIEKGIYTGTFKNEEKQAKSLLTLSKRIVAKGRNISSDENIGYFLVANRMNDLLIDEFLGTEAALRYEESNEREKFQGRLLGKMDKLNRNLDSINSSTSRLSAILQSQSRMMNNHFNKAAQDRDMKKHVTQQHQMWERTRDRYYY